MAQRRESLVVAARIEAALREFLSAGGYGAFTDTFQDLHGLRQLPGIAVQRLMADGYGFGGEGDWKIAALVRIVKLMATGLPGGSSFMEDYTYDLAGEQPLVLGSHMLEVCPSIAAARPRCEIHPLSIGSREDPVRLVFDAAPGPAFMLSMLDLGDRFRLLANEIDVIAPPQELPKLPVARAVWKPRPDFATAAEAWLVAGGPHHSVFSTALHTETLVDFATICGARAAADRRAHAQPRLRQRGALESGLSPAGGGALKASRPAASSDRAIAAPARNPVGRSRQAEPPRKARAS